MKFQKPLVSITEQKRTSIHICVLQERVTHLLASEDMRETKGHTGHDNVNEVWR